MFHIENNNNAKAETPMLLTKNGQPCAIGSIGSIGSTGPTTTINILNSCLKDFTTTHQGLATPHYFQRVQLPTPNGFPLSLSVSNMSYVDQLAFPLDDDRFRENDNRKSQCIGFFGEKSTLSSNVSTSSGLSDAIEDSRFIKAWTLCKLLRKKYSSSVAFYIEMSSAIAPQELHDGMHELILDVYTKYKTILDTLDKVQRDTKIPLSHNYNGIDYSFIVNKKPNKYPAIKICGTDNARTFLNTSYKLLLGVNAPQVHGIFFVDIRKSVLSPYYNDKGFGCYMNKLNNGNIVGLKKEGYQMLLNVVSALLYTFCPGDNKVARFHLNTIFEHYQSEASFNNNIIFATLFGHLDNTRCFYYEMLMQIYKYLHETMAGGLPFEKVIVMPFGTNATMQNLFLNLCQTVIYHPDINPNFKPKGCIQNGSLLEFQARGKIIFLGLSQTSDVSLDVQDIPCISAINMIIAKIMEYNTLINIYNNIFSPTSLYSPDYHVVLAEWRHSAFMYHSFVYSVSKTVILKQDPQLLMSSYSTSSKDGGASCDITHLHYPKVSSVDYPN